MTASFPSSVKTFTNKTDNVDTVYADDVNGVYDEVEAIETELGTDPAGGFDTVKLRFEDIESDVDDLETLVDQDVTDGSSPTLDGDNFTGIDADDVDIADAGEIITATDVEGALQEIAGDVDDLEALVDQDVTSGASPTLDGENITGIPDAALDTDYVEVAGDTVTGNITFSTGKIGIGNLGSTTLLTIKPSVQSQTNGISIQNSGGGAVFLATDAGALTITGALSKGSGTFLIDHPLDPKNKLLRYGFVEAPRYDLVHRGRVKLTKGTATVNIDSEYGLMPGTFEALTINAEVMNVQAVDSFMRVKASEIVGAEFTIESETNFDGYVNWFVLAERNDKFVKYTDETDNDGRLINEEDKEIIDSGDIEIEVENEAECGEIFEQVETDPKSKGYYMHPEAYSVEQNAPTRKVVKILKKQL